MIVLVCKLALFLSLLYPPQQDFKKQNNGSWSKKGDIVQFGHAVSGRKMVGTGCDTIGVGPRSCFFGLWRWTPRRVSGR